MSIKPSFPKAVEDHYSILRKRVDAYFKEHQISQKSNLHMYLKTALILSTLIGGYSFLLSGVSTAWSVLWIYLLLGIAGALYGMNVFHDGLHGAYSHNPALNNFLSSFLDVLGKSSYFWGNEHVNDHHIFTNVGGFDNDLNFDNPLLRLCPRAPHCAFQKAQHFYAPFLYALYFNLTQIKETIKTFHINDFKLAAKIVSLRCLHYFIFLGIPKWVLDLSWAQLLLGYLCYGIGVGMTMAFIFQLAHIVENTDFPIEGGNGKFRDPYLIHQLKTTSNFSTKNPFVTFLFGGLNFQIEHHLFPHICHVHLPKIAPIVEAMAKEYSLPYNQNLTLLQGIKSHFRMLKKLGKGDS